MICSFSPLWGAGQDAVITLIMTHTWRLKFREMKEFAHGSVPWLKSGRSHGVFCIGVCLFVWPLPACLKEPCHQCVHPCMDFLSCPCTRAPCQSTHRPFVGCSCIPGPVLGVAGCGAGEERNRSRAWCLSSQSHVALGRIHRYRYRWYGVGRNPRLASQGLGARLLDVFELVARSGGACFLFCRLGLILCVLSTSGSCSESANQLMTTQVLPLRASEIEGAFITLG